MVLKWEESRLLAEEHFLLGPKEETKKDCQEFG